MGGVRHAVRVLLIDPSDRVLLLWHSRPEDDDHWAPPGGGVEPGEDLPQAARRELREETGLSGVTLRRPVWVWQHRFSYHGALTLQHETIYATRISAAEEPHGAADDLDADGITSWRWCPRPSSPRPPRDVWPHGLAALLPSLLATDLDPDRPVDLGVTGGP